MVVSVRRAGALDLVFVLQIASIFVAAAGAVAPHENFDIYDNDWRRSVELVKDGSFRVSWRPLEHRVVFLAEARTHGYIGLGFSPDGRMSRADIAVGWVNDKSKKPYLIDCHGDDTGNGMPIKDTIQNFELLNGYQNETHTVLMFTRLWDTCDKQEDIIIGNGTIRLIWALNADEDPLDETLFNVMWHGKERRGSESLNLRNPPTIRRMDKQTKHVDLKFSNVEIPHTMPSAYWCKIFKLPTLNTKHHIIGYTPVLQDHGADSQGLIRHMVLYECNGRPSSLYRMNQYSMEKGFLCYTARMPAETESCITPVVTWAIGSQGEFLPKHVGFPIGEDSKREKYYMLETHYHNPSLKKVVDSSGLRLYYSDQLRKFDGGVFVTGTVVSPLHIIPPHQEAYKTAGYCDKYCTKDVLPTNGVSAISVVLHSHSAARGMRLRHFRQGEELAPIVQDENYNFNYQQSNELPREVTIFPEDELVTECTYNTFNRTQPTQGGYSMRQEVCLTYITYYPKVSLAACQSISPIQFFFFAFGIKKFYQYDMETIEKRILKLTNKQMRKSTASRAVSGQNFPLSTNVFDKRLNEAHIAALKQLSDYSIDEDPSAAIDDSANLFQDLLISEPAEFQNKTFNRHLLDLPWREIQQKVEDMFYYGKHMTFCRLADDSLALPASVHQFPNVSLYQADDDEIMCKTLPSNTKNRKSWTNDSSHGGRLTNFAFVGLFAFPLILACLHTSC